MNPARIKQFKNAIRNGRYLLSTNISCLQMICFLVSRTNGELSKSQAEMWTWAREYMERLPGDYAALLRCERLVRRYGVRLSRWHSRDLIESVLSTVRKSR